MRINDNQDSNHKKYLEKKLELDKLRDDITLKRYEILKSAKALGKKIWGRDFTIVKLSGDMDIPYTTVKRCLALENANDSNWKLVKEKKLSAFKLAMICQLKSKTYQDEICKMVVKDNLSTHQIKTLKVNGLKDINVERHRLAIEKGYSRRDSAYRSFSQWTSRGMMFTITKPESLGKTYAREIQEKLKLLDVSLSRFIGNLEVYLLPDYKIDRIKPVKGRVPKRFKRNCLSCDKPFRPDGKSQKTCHPCQKENHAKAQALTKAKNIKTKASD